MREGLKKRRFTVGAHHAISSKLSRNERSIAQERRGREGGEGWGGRGVIYLEFIGYIELVRIKEKKDEVGPLCEPAAHVGEVVPEEG